jgi:SsrA-binding protein
MRAAGATWALVVAEGEKTIANNRAAFHEYFILDKIEAGLELLGTEVKSLRAGKVNIKDGFIRIENRQAFLENVHIQPWEAGNRQNHEPTRSRRLLMHRSEIVELFSKVREQGLTLVPLRLYFRNGRAKVEVALVKGKKSWDKRQSIAERDAKREMQRAIRRDSR